MASRFCGTMDGDIEVLRKDIAQLRREVELIRHILEEDYDLDEKTRRALAEARKTPMRSSNDPLILDQQIASQPRRLEKMNLDEL